MVKKLLVTGQLIETGIFLCIILYRLIPWLSRPKTYIFTYYDKEYNGGWSGDKGQELVFSYSEIPNLKTTLYWRERTHSELHFQSAVVWIWLAVFPHHCLALSYLSFQNF